jgi:hypothetical protein
LYEVFKQLGIRQKRKKIEFNDSKSILFPIFVKIIDFLLKHRKNTLRIK